MRKLHPSITCVLTVAIFAASAFADTITLKTGEHLEGKITKETDKDVTIEVKVSAGIVDERVVAKVLIEKVDKVTPELQAFQAISSIQVGQNSLPDAQYEPYINALQAYVKQFPNSPRTPDVQKTLQAFQDENKRVEAGEVKINGQWLSKIEVEKERAQVGGRLAFNYMKGQSTAGDYVGALNAFAALEKTYPGAAVMPDAIELALKIIPALKTEVERAIPEQKVYKAEREKGLKAAGPEERAQIAESIKAEDTAAEAAAVAADAGNHWAPMNKNNLKCLTSLATRADKEGKRLATLNVAKMRQSIQLSETAKRNLANGDVEGANKTLKDAGTLWPANEMVKRLAADAAEKKAASVAEAAAAAPEPSTPAPVTPKPKPKPSTPRPSASAQEGAAPVASAPDEDDRPFYKKPAGAIGMVVGLTAVLAGANIFVKMKKRKAEQAQ